MDPGGSVYDTIRTDIKDFLFGSHWSFIAGCGLGGGYVFFLLFGLDDIPRMIAYGGGEENQLDWREE